MSEMTVTAQALQKIRGNNDWRDGSSNVSWFRDWRRRRDVQRQSFPQSGSSDRKSSSPMVEQQRASDNKRWCRSRAETLTSLVSRWLVEFLSEVRQSCLV